MAEIELERKRRSLVPFIIGLLLLAIIVWIVIQLFDGDERTASEPIAEPVPAAPAATGDVLPVIVIVTTPADHAGRTVSGTANVAEVISDRGFWIEQQGQRLFVVIDEPVPETIDINAGQTVRLTGTIYTQEMVDRLPGQLEEQTRRIATGERVFLLARAQDVTITDRPATQP